uniref:Uncharacterized protein n=4 Tax=unclassified bacterial viruses TaxID=12333 RepID=A0AAU6W122_9VIRU
MILNQTVDNLMGDTFTHGSSMRRFGGAHRDGHVNFYYWDDVNCKHVMVRKKCGSYRKAQRKLLQWLKGYNV